MIKFSSLRTYCSYSVCIAAIANPNSRGERFFFFWRPPVYL